METLKDPPYVNNSRRCKGSVLGAEQRFILYTLHGGDQLI